MTDLNPKPVTVRASGKCHPAIEFKNGQIMLVCTCPGSKNGRLAAAAVKVADGYALVTCRNPN